MRMRFSAIFGTPTMASPTFVWLSRAWYGVANLPPHGRTADEVRLSGPGDIDVIIRWQRLSKGPEPFLEMASEGWPALAHPIYRSFFAWLAAWRVSRGPPPAIVVDKLRQFGFTDVTPRTPGR